MIRTFSALFALLMISNLTLVGCQNKKPKGSSEDASSVPGDSVSNSGLKLELNGSSDSNTAGGLQTVYFDFDSSSLRGDTKSALDNNAAFLKANASVQVQIEGHCDERGGVQYNVALGEKRAKVVRDYLKALGVSDSRMSTISYGKEKPVSFGHEEDAWSKNRRANFAVTSK